MALIPEPTSEQIQALDVARRYFNQAASQARTQLMALDAFGTRGLVAAEFAQSFHRTSEMCEMVLEMFPDGESTTNGRTSVAV
jgi:hypothetical protein